MDRRRNQGKTGRWLAAAWLAAALAGCSDTLETVPAAVVAGKDAAADADAIAAVDAAPDAPGVPDAGPVDVAAPPADSDAAIAVDVAAGPDAADGVADTAAAPDAADLADAGDVSDIADVLDSASIADVPDAAAPPDAASADAGQDAPALPDAATDAVAVDAATAPPKPNLYDPDYMPKFELVVGPDAMAVLMDPSDATKTTWVHAAFTCEGETFADVGLRRKGSSTYRVIPQKAAFKVKFNKWVPGLKFRGYKELTLNNMVDDATGLRERLAYALYAALKMPASKCNTATVTLNGEAYGPYANLESTDDQFLKSYFGANASSLYEVDWGSEWLPGSEDGMLVQVGDPAKTDLLKLFGAMEAAKDATLLADMKGHLDTEQWLTFCAIEALIAERDNYAYGIWGSHNHFLAGGLDGLFRLIPWSTDLSFSDGNGIVDVTKPLPADPQEGGDTLLMRCQKSDACWTAFKAHVSTAIAAYQAMDMAGLAKQWHAQIDAVQSADTKRESSLAYYQSSIVEMNAWIAARPGLVKSQLGIP